MTIVAKGTAAQPLYLFNLSFLMILVTPVELEVKFEHILSLLHLFICLVYVYIVVGSFVT